MIIIQLTKLRKVNHEIDKISTENKGYTPPDVSTNESISNNVEILLQRQGFISPTNKDEEIILDGFIDDENQKNTNKNINQNEDQNSQESDSETDDFDIDIDLD